MIRSEFKEIRLDVKKTKVYGDGAGSSFIFGTNGNREVYHKHGTFNETVVIRKDKCIVFGWNVFTIEKFEDFLKKIYNRLNSTPITILKNARNNTVYSDIVDESKNYYILANGRALPKSKYWKELILDNRSINNLRKGAGATYSSGGNNYVPLDKLYDVMLAVHDAWHFLYDERKEEV